MDDGKEVGLFRTNSPTHNSEVNNQSLCHTATAYIFTD